MTEFKVGDTVMLKSGGPVMTVTALDRIYDEDPELSVYCSWFASGNERKADVFPPATLVKKQV